MTGSSIPRTNSHSFEEEERAVFSKASKTSARTCFSDGGFPSQLCAVLSHPIPNSAMAPYTSTTSPVATKPEAKEVVAITLLNAAPVGLAIGSGGGVPNAGKRLMRKRPG